MAAIENELAAEANKVAAPDDEDGLWKEGARLIKKHEKRYAGAFLDAVGSLRSYWEGIAELAQKGEKVDLRKAFAAINWQKDFAQPLAASFEAHQTNVLLDSVKMEERRIQAQKATTPLQPTEQRRARSWLSSASSKRVVDITKEQRAWIRRVTEEGVREGLGTAPVARKIAQQVGLDERRRNALFRFQERLEKQGVAGDRLLRKVQREYQKKLRSRATNIARTEILQARTNGMVGKWRGEIRAGIVHPQARKRWILSPKPCPVCQGIAATKPEIGINETWDSPGGKILGPPAHPSCLCSIALQPPTEADLLVEPAGERDLGLAARVVQGFGGGGQRKPVIAPLPIDSPDVDLPEPTDLLDS